MQCRMVGPRASRQPDVWRLATLILLLLLPAAPLHAAAAARPRVVLDAAGERVVLAQPARRIVTLTPHLSEVVFALGAGDRLLAVSDHSDYPAQARRLPRIGDAFNVQLEAVLALHPDLVLAWGASGHGLPRAALLRAGAAMYVSRPVQLLDVARELRAIGVLLGREVAAARAARDYEARLLRAARTPVRRRVFLQLGAPSLYTVGDQHYLGEALRLCGAVNPFAELRGSAPLVSAEAVLARHPDIVLMLDSLPQGTAVLWQRRGLHDVRVVSADLVGRPGPRLAEGVEQMCSVLRR